MLNIPKIYSSQLIYYHFYELNLIFENNIQKNLQFFGINKLLRIMSQKKKGTKVQQDQTTQRIPNMYKRKCQSNGITMNKVLRDKVQIAIEQGKLQTLQIWQDLGAIQVRAFMESLSELNYHHLKKIRLWKVNVDDEGLRSICNYIEKVNSVEYLDLMDNNITPLGCEFLSRVLINGNNRIVKLKLDNNPLTTQGLANLSVGLRENSSIEKLSFNYCGIDSNGMKYIQEIMANIHCKLRSLKLQGNPLGNQGAYQLLRSVAICGQKLQKINMGDVGMNLFNYKIQIGISQQEKITKQLIHILQNNVNIAKYNFKNNFIPDDVAKLMIECAKENKNIFIIDLPDCIAHELKELHAETMKKRKPKKKKKKGSKKTKKK